MMEQIIELLSTETVTVIVGIIGGIITIFATGISDRMKAKAELDRTTMTKEEFESRQNLVFTFVEAAEKIFGALKGPEKFNYVFEQVEKELNKRNIPIDSSHLEGLIESAVVELNRVDKTLDEITKMEYDSTVETKVETPESKEMDPF